MWYYKTKLRTQRTPHVITVSHHYLSTSALTVSRDDNADSVADISPITVSSDILVRWESAVVTKKIKMSDKGYVLTANDSKNFTVKQLQILFHYFLTTDTAVISWFRLAHHDDWTSKEPGYKMAQISPHCLLSYGDIGSSLDDWPSYFNMCDALTTNDRINFTVSQLYMLLNHFTKHIQPQSHVSWRFPTFQKLCIPKTKSGQSAFHNSSVGEYNKHIGGTDRMDKNTAMYRIGVVVAAWCCNPQCLDYSQVDCKWSVSARISATNCTDVSYGIQTSAKSLKSLPPGVRF